MDCSLLRRIFVILSIISCVLLLSSCNHYAKIPKLGDKIPTALIESETKTDLIMGNGKILNSFDVTINDISFLLAADSGNIVLFINTIDSNFVSPEGIRVGMPIRNALEIANSEIKRKIWTHYTEYYVTLPSGWQAAIQSKEKPNPDEPIQVLLKNRYLTD